MSQNVNVNLVPGNYPKEFHVSQYDVGRQLVANIVDSTGAYSIPSGATVTLVGTKPSGFGFTLSGSVGSGGVVTFSTTATVTAEYGRIPCELRITSGSTILGTANCMLIVEESPHPEGTTDGDGEQIISEITLLLQRITEQADRADQAVTDATAQANRATAQATAAAGSASAAASSESNAAASATTAVGAKNDAVAAKTAAEASEASAAESAAEARETLETYAKVGGEYDAMTVGTAKQLLSDSTTTDTEPYIYRQTAGDADREEVEEVVGGTVAWNQKVMHGNFDSTTDWYKGVGVDSWSASSNVLTANINGGSVLDPYKYGIWKNINGGLDATHKYLSVYGIKPSVATTFRLELGGGVKKATATLSADVWSEVSFVNTPSTYNPQMYLYPFSAVFNVSAPEMTIQYRNAQLFDLTAMFGSTIADAIYAMEQASAGAGVAWFRKLFPKDYYPYDAGSLQSVKPSAHVTTGFNQWDEEWELGGINNTTGAPTVATDRIRSKNFCPCLPSTVYYGFDGSASSGMAVYIWFYDADKSFISGAGIGNGTATTPSNARYFKISTYGGGYTSYKSDICINISDPSRNGTYEPYDGRTYPLSPIDLRGIPKWVDGRLKFDGDVYEADGTVTRRYGIVDLGTLAWGTTSGATSFKAACPSDMALVYNVDVAKWMCKYPTVAGNDFNSSTYASSLLNTSHVFIKDPAFDGKTPAEVKSALSGTYLVYELATATTETADPYTSIQICDPNGTEEWTDERTVQIPVGNVTKYHANLKGKLEDLPAIPTAPSANGTYTLKATVSGGAVTYQWVNG